MITVKVNDINNFLAASNHIKTNALYPVLEYIKLQSDEAGNLEFIKTNMNSWISYKATCHAEAEDTEIYLVDERILKGFVMQLGADHTVEIFSDTEKVYLKWEDREVSFQNMDLKDFPPFPDKNRVSPEYVIGADVVKDIKTAQVYCNSSAGIYDTVFNFVSLSTNGDVFASNGHFMYLKRHAVLLPEALLNAEACNVLNPEMNYIYFEKDNYYFFGTGNSILGFIKSEFRKVNYKMIAEAGDDDSFFRMPVDEMLNFCRMCSAAAKEIIPVATLDGNKLLYEDASFNIKVKANIEITGDVKPNNFTFNTQFFNRYISPLPYKSLKVVDVGTSHYKILADDDANYLGVFSKIAPKVSA